MPDITVSKETLYRQESDEFGVVNVLRIARITDDEGNTFDRKWRRAYTPDDDISGLPTRLQAIITAARYPDAVARFEAQKAQE